MTYLCYKCLISTYIIRSHGGLKNMWHIICTRTVGGFLLPLAYSIWHIRHRCAIRYLRVEQWCSGSSLTRLPKRLAHCSSFLISATNTFTTLNKVLDVDYFRLRDSDVWVFIYLVFYPILLYLTYHRDGWDVDRRLLVNRSTIYARFSRV